MPIFLLISAVHWTLGRGIIFVALTSCWYLFSYALLITGFGARVKCSPGSPLTFPDLVLSSRLKTLSILMQMISPTVLPWELTLDLYLTPFHPLKTSRSFYLSTSIPIFTHGDFKIWAGNQTNTLVSISYLQNSVSTSFITHSHCYTLRFCHCW